MNIFRQLRETDFELHPGDSRYSAGHHACTGRNSVDPHISGTSLCVSRVFSHELH